MIQFEHSEWLWTLPAGILLLLFLILRTEAARRKLLGKFASKNLLVNLASTYSPLRQKIKSLLILLAFAFLVISMARPQWGHEWNEVRGKGVDILFALDASKSMLARDIKPNRLERAKLGILDFIREIKEDRLGLIAFEGRAFLQSPLTLDYHAFRNSLDAIKPGLLPVGGSNIGAAINEAIATFENDNNFKFLILISDGEDLGNEGIAAAEKAARENIKIFTVGIGSSEGARIPVYDNRGRASYLRDSHGNFVVSRLDESTLREIAGITGGFYVPMGMSGEGLRTIYTEGLADVPREQLETRMQQIPLERYQLFLFIALVLLILEFLIGNRKTGKATASAGPVTSNAARVIFAASILFAASPEPAMAKPGDEAFDLYSQGKYEEAEKLYRQLAEKDPDNLLHRYNLACTAFNNGNWERAARLFSETLKTTDLDLQADAFYNLGNTAFHRGEEMVQSDPRSTVKLWEEALNHYRNALELRPDDSNAAYNIKVVEELLEKLKEQQKSQSQQQEGRDQDNREEQNQEDSSQDSPEGENSQERQQDSGSDPSRQQQGGENSDPRENQQEDTDSGMNPEEQGQPQPANPEDQDGSGAGDDAPEGSGLQSLPMSREEAEQILEAMRQSEKKLPFTGLGVDEDAEKSRDVKDW